VYVLAEMDVQVVVSKSIIAKYSDGSEQKLSLGEQVDYASGGSGAILPQIYTGSIWVRDGDGTSYGQSAGMPRGDWFRSGLYSHPVTPDSEKVLTEIIIPCNRNANGEITIYGFTTYAITLKVADEKGSVKTNIKNLSNDDISVDIISLKQDGSLKINNAQIEKNNSRICDLLSEDAKIFFWDLKTLTPYANVVLR
jgi:hypothetical protein